MTTYQFWAPLKWPTDWPRAKSRKWARFGEHSIAACTDELVRELDRLGANNAEISSNLTVSKNSGYPLGNQKQPSDPGIACYFELKGHPRVLACDAWTSVEDNLWAIVKHIDALRGQNRWGVGSIDQAFAGYAALPPSHDTRTPAIQVLGLAALCTQEEIRARYRELAKIHHPDAGGDPEKFKEIARAYCELCP